MSVLALPCFEAVCPTVLLCIAQATLLCIAQATRPQSSGVSHLTVGVLRFAGSEDSHYSARLLLLRPQGLNPRSQPSLQAVS